MLRATCISINCTSIYELPSRGNEDLFLQWEFTKNSNKSTEKLSTDPQRRNKLILKIKFNAEYFRERAINLENCGAMFTKVVKATKAT